jgi:hypothetical protein
MEATSSVSRQLSALLLCGTRWAKTRKPTLVPGVMEANDLSIALLAESMRRSPPWVSFIEPEASKRYKTCLCWALTLAGQAVIKVMSAAKTVDIKLARLLILLDLFDMGQL